MKSTCVLLLLLFSAGSLAAQNIPFSQYNFTSQQVNPALIGLTRDASADAVFRHQRGAGDLQINTGYFGAALPFFRRNIGKPSGGIGVTLVSDDIGSFLKSQDAAVSWAMNFPAGKNQIFSLGVRALMRLQRISLDDLYTGTQFVQGYGFNTLVNNGEDAVPSQQHYSTYSAGMLWQKTDRKGKVLQQVGIAVQDFNEPRTGFTSGEPRPLPATLVMHGGWVAYQIGKWTAIPELLYTFSGNRSMILGGSRFSYKLNRKDRMDVLVKTAQGRSGILGMQLHRTDVSLGLSFDFPVSARSVQNLGSVEIGLEYRSPMDPKSRKSRSSKKNKKKKGTAASKKNQAKVPAKKHGTGSKPSVADQQIKPADSTVSGVKPKPSGSGQPNKAVTTTGQTPVVVKETRILHFRFAFNSAELDDETQEYLAGLKAELSADPSLFIRVVGHTDNKGSDDSNVRLSLRRAEAIRDYLADLGVALSRIATDGKGMREPLNANATAEERALNRRVEITLLYRK